MHPEEVINYYLNSKEQACVIEKECYVCNAKAKCQTGSPMDELGYCFNCLCTGERSVPVLFGLFRIRKTISLPVWEEMMDSLEAYNDAHPK